MLGMFCAAGGCLLWLGGVVRVVRMSWCFRLRRAAGRKMIFAARFVAYEVVGWRFAPNFAAAATLDIGSAAVLLLSCS